MGVKANMVANYVGQGWRALAGVVCLPLYIRYIGVEAYGLIGIFAMLQAWLTLLDMGMKPTLSRELARYTAGHHDIQSTRDLLRSIEVIASIIAAVVFVAMLLASHWLANSWLKTGSLPVETVARALLAMGAVIALRFVEDIYVSAIVGLQRQVLENALSVLFSTLRIVGAIAVLAWISPTIGAFFLWQVLVSAAAAAAYALAAHRCLPAASRAARFSWPALTEIWRFAAGMTLISGLALMLTQIDKVLLSRMLSLKDFGFYSLAATIASSIYVLIAPITTAYFPRLTAHATRGEEDALREAYHQSAQLVSVAAGSCAVILILFADPLLLLWSGNPELARSVAPLLKVLTLGMLLHGFTWIPYQLQLAHGWTTLAIKINIAAAFVVVPAILWFVPRFGAIAAAWTWVALTAGYNVFTIYFMHRRLLTAEKWRWYREDIAMPMIAAVAAGLACRWLEPRSCPRCPTPLQCC